MTHSTSPEFWDHFDRLPQEVQDLARKKFDLLKSNPTHFSLHFMQIDRFWSVRIGLYYRALGLDVDDGVIWFWIGSHPEYDRIIG